MDFILRIIGEPLKDVNLGSELTRLTFWEDLSISRSDLLIRSMLRADGLWPSATLRLTVYKCLTALLVQDNTVKRGEESLKQAKS